MAAVAKVTRQRKGKYLAVFSPVPVQEAQKPEAKIKMIPVPPPQKQKPEIPQHQHVCAAAQSAAGTCRRKIQQRKEKTSVFIVKRKKLLMFISHEFHIVKKITCTK